MKGSTNTNYLRMHRKRACLSQAEVAFLLGSEDRTTVSRHELSLREPALASGFVYQLLYGIALTELFAELRSEVDARLRERAAILLARIKAEAESSTRERRMEHLLRLVDADEHLIIPVWED